jgi:hypothetical protein
MARQIKEALEDSRDMRLKLKELSLAGYKVEMSKMGEKIGTITGLDTNTGLVWKCEVRRWNIIAVSRYPAWHVAYYHPIRRARTVFGGWVWSADEAYKVVNLFTERYEPFGQS